MKKTAFLIAALLITGCDPAVDNESIAETIDDPSHPSIPTAEEDNGPTIESVSAKTDCEEICLEVERVPRRVGEPITGTITWNGMPEDAVLNIYLSPTESRTGRDPPVENGRHGALLRKAYPLGNESGAIRFRWKGSGFWCAPTDYPMICDEAPPADTYNLTASILTSSADPMGVLQTQSWPNPVKPAKSIAKDVEGPFSLE